MTTQVLLTLSDHTVERVQSLSYIRQRELADRIVEYLEATLPDSGQQTDTQYSKRSKALAGEEAAYLKLHPQLKRTHKGQYVAIYGGELIDEDTELGAMVERVRSKYPQQVIWMTKVSDEPISTIFKCRNFYVEKQMGSNLEMSKYFKIASHCA